MPLSELLEDAADQDAGAVQALVALLRTISEDILPHIPQPFMGNLLNKRENGSYLTVLHLICHNSGQQAWSLNAVGQPLLTVLQLPGACGYAHPHTAQVWCPTRPDFAAADSDGKQVMLRLVGAILKFKVRRQTTPQLPVLPRMGC